MIYAEEILQQYPNSRYAPQARELLAELQPGSVEPPDRFASIRKRLRRESTDEAVEVPAGRANSSRRASIPNSE